MASAGRPRVLDDTKMREVCALITAGYGIPSAAQYVGCSASTIRREVERNQEFGERVRRALLTSELDPLNSIRQSARSNWRAAAWYLERTNPQKYARRNAMTLTPENVQEFMEAVADVIFTEVRSPVVRQRILRRFLKMTGQMGVSPPPKDMEGLEPPPGFDIFEKKRRRKRPNADQNSPNENS